MHEQVSTRQKACHSMSVCMRRYMTNDNKKWTVSNIEQVSDQVLIYSSRTQQNTQLYQEATDYSMSAWMFVIVSE